MKFQPFARSQTPQRAAISAAYRREEQACMADLLRLSADLLSNEQKQTADVLARQLVKEVRIRRRQQLRGVSGLMHAFSLSSKEGLALMCLAEALLRIPDTYTADLLIRDKMTQGEWYAKLPQSPTLLVRAATWGLGLTGQLLKAPQQKGWQSALLGTLASGAAPLIRGSVNWVIAQLGEQFVTGQTIEQALLNARAREAQGYRFSYDMLGEAALTAEDAQRYFNDYLHAIHAIGQASAARWVIDGPGISVKLSALEPRYSRSQMNRVMQQLLPRLKELFLLAKHYDIGLNIDAEEADRLELSLDLIDALAHDPDLAGFQGFGIVVQAYQKRCPFVIDYLIDLARATQHRFMIRLVKGAYWDSEIKRAQIAGLTDYPVFTRKVHTDLSYLACAKKLLAAPDAVYPQFATHNAHSVAAIFAQASGLDYEFQCLHGMGEPLYDQIVGHPAWNKTCRIYAPVGSHHTLLAYLVRRLLENGANSSFVNRIVDESVSIDELIADPIEIVKREGGRPHPGIVLPPQLFGETRRNSAGLDLSSEPILATLQQGLMASAEHSFSAHPLLGDGGQGSADHERVVTNPADRTDRVGRVKEATEAEVAHAIDLACQAQATWAATPVSERADYLERVADLLERHRYTLMTLALREAGKTLANAVAEVREAVDFCRYYAEQIRHHLTLPHTALGPIVCISPWNFPLAIFVGEISAALAAGNTVLAKPAEQTCLMAAEAVRLFHQAGIDRAVLQLLPGRGTVVGAALTRNPRIAGVIFTGSTEVAASIQRNLAARAEETVLIAETSGQNAMIVDSSALLEQVAHDVILSAFDSAGQRCSALRILYVQEEVADRLIHLLQGAMAELEVGNPAQLQCDIGPVIDEEAKERLVRHISTIKPRARFFYQLPLPQACDCGSFFAPTLIEIDAEESLHEEVFGPILHIIRFAARDLERVIDKINSTGFGLTFGVHSRVDSTIERLTQRICAGNLYINRNTIGAVVGVQPFGGERRSGTGPKAGGPLYLTRLQHLEAPLALPLSKRVDMHIPGLLALQNSLSKLALNHSERAALSDHLHTLETNSPLMGQLTLPAPTGESNTLFFAPRGIVGCMATPYLTLLNIIGAALATGNHVVLFPSEHASQLASLLPEWISVSTDLLSLTHLDAVLFAGLAHEAQSLRQRLAQRSGALVALIVADESGQRCNPYRLIVERVISVNTAAAGGNASLMNLKE